MPDTTHRAAGILFETTEGETLLLVRGDGGDYPRTFGFPYGHAEGVESPEQTARRETREETGFDYTGPLQVLSESEGCVTFIARGVEKFPVTICDESMGFMWAKPGELPAPMHPRVPVDLRIAAATTELDLAELIRDGLLPSPQKIGNSWLFALRITGSGMAYRSALEQHVFREPALFANERFAQRCNGLFVVWGHPEKTKLLTSESFDDSVVGTVMLPYVRGDEVWGIARIMNTTAAEEMQRVQLSTSPGVAHTTESEGATVTLDGGEILLEGVPVLLDHLAVCELGVWDKGGPPMGVQIDQLGGAEMPDNAAKADSNTAGATPPAIDMTALGAMFADSIASALKPLHARLDSFEKNMPSAPLKGAADSTEEIEKKAKADAEATEAKAKADAEEEEKKAKADAEEKAKMDADKAKADSIKNDEDAGKFADAQAKCDSVANLYNQRAGSNLVGETLTAFRLRNLKPFQQHSKQWKDVNLAAIADSAAFEIAEAAIYADAVAAARTYTGGKAGLREMRRVDRNTGRTIIEFAGPDTEWMKPFVAPTRRLTPHTKEA